VASTGVDQPELTAVVPPGAPPRRAAAFQNNLGTTATAAVLSVATAGVTWWMLWYFDQSLHVDGTQLVVARVIEVALAALAITVPVYGVRALVATGRGMQRASRGEFQEARIAVEDSRDYLWVVVGVGLTTLVVAFVAFLLAGNDGSVRRIMFNWTFVWDRSHVALIRGFWLNIKLFVVAELLVLPWSLLVAVVRLLPGRACRPVRILAIAYIDAFRGVPAIITIYLIVFGFALAGVPVFKGMSSDNQIFWLAILALVLVYGAYVAEVYRAGLESIHWSQTAAARSLGLSQWQTLRHVVIPQAVRRIIPPLLNDFVALQKDTALVSIVGALEILNVSTQLKNRFFNLSPVTGAAMFFLVITIPCTRFVDWLIKRDRSRIQAQ
jgi:polar amino acid transport system permease protein